MMSVHWAKQTFGCERRDLILTREYVRKPTVWVVKFLALTGAGPVGLLCTQKVGIKYKKPLRDPSETDLRKGTRGEEESNALSAVRTYRSIVSLQDSGTTR